MPLLEIMILVTGKSASVHLLNPELKNVTRASSWLRMHLHLDEEASNGWTSTVKTF